MNIALLVITDGRWDYLTETLRSIDRNISVDWAQKIVVDDSGLPDPPPMDLSGWTLIKNTPRKGLGAAVRAGWEALGDVDYVWHHEDDFTFTETPPIDAMSQRLETEPGLAQIALMRQPWSPLEKLNGSVYATTPERYTERDGLVWQRSLFTFNPSIYPKWVTKAVNVGLGLEQDVTDQLLEHPEIRFAYWGTLKDAPRVWHIGVRRSDGYHW